MLCPDMLHVSAATRVIEPRLGYNKYKASKQYVRAHQGDGAPLSNKDTAVIVTTGKNNRRQPGGDKAQPPTQLCLFDHHQTTTLQCDA